MEKKLALAMGGALEYGIIGLTLVVALAGNIAKIWVAIWLYNKCFGV